MVHRVTANGANIPAIGFGTWPMKGQECIGAIHAALDAGYSHIDTASMYKNESEVGEAIAGHAKPRGEIFVTTKVWYEDIADGDLQRSAEDSLARLGLDDVDLLLIHWPNSDIPLAESIGALCDARRKGLARHIGVSNFPSRLLEQAISLADEPICVNQVEYHPFLNQDAVLSVCRAHGLAMTAYAPIARAGALFDTPAIRDLAREKGKSEAQIVLRWHIQQPNVVAIPKSATAERIRANIALDDFELSDEEMARISALARPDGRTIAPEWSPQWDAVA